jgi:hypothetical protein
MVGRGAAHSAQPDDDHVITVVAHVISGSGACRGRPPVRHARLPDSWWSDMPR